MSQYEDLLIDALLDDGFTLEEAERLIELQTRSDREGRRQEAQEAERQCRLWLGEDGEHIWN